jgi:hypothetical protein
VLCYSYKILEAAQQHAVVGVDVARRKPLRAPTKAELHPETSLVLHASLPSQRITHPGVIRKESGQIRGSAIDRQQRPSPLVSLVLLGLRAGVHSTALPACTMIWLYAALTLRTNNNAVAVLLHVAVRLLVTDERQETCQRPPQSQPTPGKVLAISMPIVDTSSQERHISCSRLPALLSILPM